MRVDNPGMVSTPGRRRERGTAIIEFALVFPLLLVVTICVIDVSRGFWVKNITTQAAREGARLVIQRTLSDTAAVRLRVEDFLNNSDGPPLAGVSPTLTVCSLEDLGDKQWKVTVGASFKWMYPGLFSWVGLPLTNPATLEAACTMRRLAP